MIQRLQEETAEQNIMRESGKGTAFKSALDNSQLLSRVLATVQG